MDDKSKQPVVLPKNGTRRRKLLFAAVVLVIVAALGWLAWSREKSKSSEQDSMICSSELLNRAGGSFIGSEVGQITPIVDEIQAIENYEQDPNCLNVIAAYYIELSDYTKAKETLEKLEKVYDAETGFSEALGSGAPDIEEIRSSVEFLKKQQEASENNSYGIQED